MIHTTQHVIRTPTHTLACITHLHVHGHDTVTPLAHVAYRDCPKSTTELHLFVCGSSNSTRGNQPHEIKGGNAKIGDDVLVI